MLRSEAQGQLETYNNYGDMWKLDVTDFVIKIGKTGRKYKRARILFKETS